MHLSPKTRSFFPLPSLGFLHTNRLAGLPQTLRRSFWALQRFCKSAFPHFGVCRTPARTLFPILVFAELLQGRFSSFWCLQNFCKNAFPHFGVCRTSARALFPILAFAELLQGPFFPFWRLQDFCKSAFSPFWCLQNFCKDAFPHFGVCRTLPLHTSQISGDPRAHWYRGVDEIRLFLPIFYR